MTYTDQQKAHLVLMLVEEAYDYAQLKTRFRSETRNGRAKIPEKRVIVKWIDDFRATGSVHGKRGKNKPKRVRTKEAIEDVREAFTANPHLSTRRNPFVSTGDTDSEEDDHGTVRMSQRSLQRILKEDLQMRPYHLQMAHALEETDYAARIEFARTELDRLDEDANRLNNLLFTDEAHFHLDGSVNRQDWIMWADENPHWFDVRRLHPQKLTVWMGIGVEGVVGPYFWERQGNERGINGRWMTELYQEHVIPELQTWPNFNSLIEQHDGAPPHILGDFLELLGQQFPNRWIGRRTRAHPAPVTWPPRSPDLTACDYWLWGYMKGRIYHSEQRPSTLEELRAAIEGVANEIRGDRALRERVVADYRRRLHECFLRDGGQVEIR